MLRLTGPIDDVIGHSTAIIKDIDSQTNDH